MKKLTFVPIAISLLLCVSAAAQQNSRSGEVHLQKTETATTGKRVVTLSGRMGNDGKTLVSEDQDQWVVANPEALAGQQGHTVTVKCQLSQDQTSIHVLSVNGAAESNYKATQDAAFRK
jgi:hypothetical protein